VTKDEALKLALEALDGLSEPYDVLKAQEAIREALAHPEQEPVAWATMVGDFAHVRWGSERPNYPIPYEVPLYTTPPHRKPLTDVEIWNTYKNLWMFHPAEEPRLAGDVLKFARAIEQAHGIKE